MHRPTIIEVALNGPWGRGKQPLSPVSVADIVRDGIDCARAGASVIHVHPYNDATGKQDDRLDIYLAIIEGIREQVDALVYPTAPFVDNDGVSRYGVTEALAQRGLIEWATVDPGSLNVTRFDELARGAPGFVYRNPTEVAAQGMAVAAAHQITPSYALYEPGMVRLGMALHAAYPRAPTPVYRVMLSDEFTFGPPPGRAALDTYESLWSLTPPDAIWMLAGLGFDIAPHLSEAIERGWHLRVGLEDAPFGSTRRNVDWVTLAARRVEEAGRAIATPAQARAMSGHQSAT